MPLSPHLAVTYTACMQPASVRSFHRINNVKKEYAKLDLHSEIGLSTPGAQNVEQNFQSNWRFKHQPFKILNTQTYHEWWVVGNVSDFRFFIQVWVVHKRYIYQTYQNFMIRICIQYRILPRMIAITKLCIYICCVTQKGLVWKQKLIPYKFYAHAT